MKVAVVTPYFNEPHEWLWRCHESVLKQTYPATHLIVADGRPSEAVASWACQHTVLPVTHADGGDTPRGIAAISALNQGFDAIAFLDADNWYAPNHIETCVDACRQSGSAVAFASRQIVLSTGQLCPFEDIDVVEKRHVDTSCFFICKEAALMAVSWGLVDPAVWQACDRIVFRAIQQRKIPHTWTDQRSVFYTSHWGAHFAAMGLSPPEDEHHIAWRYVRRSYDPGILEARFGFDVGLDLHKSKIHLPSGRTVVPY
jgi:glycosyltransferase involved in cell wall biosynthesis